MAALALLASLDHATRYTDDARPLISDCGNAHHGPVVLPISRAPRRCGGYDDALDAFGVHGVGGALGAVLMGVFAAKAFNSAGADGLLRGDTSLFVTQLVGVAAAAAFSVVVTLIVLKIVDVTVGLRVTSDEEIEGLDVALHGESGYEMAFGGASEPSPSAPEASRVAAVLAQHSHG